MGAPLTTSIGFDNVSLPGTAGSYVQMPDIVCDVVGFGKTSGDIRLAVSANPGASYVVLDTAASGSGNTGQVAIPTGGNASNLYIANDTGTAQVVGFMWMSRSAIFTAPAI
jgi:hypothetical protein